jgi:hypothetical protein
MSHRIAKALLSLTSVIAIAVGPTTSFAAGKEAPVGEMRACTPTDADPTISHCLSGDLKCGGGRKFCCEGSVCKDAGSGGKPREQPSKTIKPRAGGVQAPTITMTAPTAPKN